MSKVQKSATGSQLQKGYKQTEVGSIPEDWEVKQLKNISPSQSVGLVINPSSYFDGNGSVPMLVGSHINENGIDWESANRISNVSNNLLPSSRLAAGDLVTVRVGDPGLTAVVPSELDGCNCASMMIVRQHRSFDSCWLCYVMNSPFGRSQIEHVQYGTAQKQFNISDAVDFLYPVPLLNEQKAIAHALSDIDALIESLDRLLTKKRQIKQGAMQELLSGRKRLPVFTNRWKERYLGDVAEIVMGQSPKSSCYNIQGKGLPLIQGNADISNRQTIKRIFTTEITKRGSCGDIIMSVRAPVGEIARAMFDNCLGRGVCSIRYDNNFLYHYLIWREPDWIELSKGSTFDSVNSADIRAFKLFIPNETEEQVEIATILSDMDVEIDAIEAKLTKTRQIKQGMMHELLTGRIRLI